MHHMLQIMAFIGMDAPGQHQDPMVADAHRVDLAAVPVRARRCEARRSAIGTDATGSPSSATAGAQPEPSTTATSWRSMPVRSAMAGGAGAWESVTIGELNAAGN